MKQLRWRFILSFFYFSFRVFAAPDFDPATDLQGVGVNPSGIDWRNANYEFADLIRQGNFWNGFKLSDVDQNGYPKTRTGQLNFSNINAIPWLRGRFFTPGLYTLTWEGAGDVTLSAASANLIQASQDLSGPVNKRVYDIKLFAGDMFVSVNSLPAQNIHFWMPGYEDGTRQFHNLFVERIRPFALMRFMDWGKTNNSKQVSWADRRIPSYCLQSVTVEEWDGPSGGAAYEIMIDLCNLTKNNGWFCVPHQATDDYVQNLATLLRDQMDPSLKVYIEYSNEVWNNNFKQAGWVKNQNGGDQEGGYGRRAAAIFTIFETVFAQKINSHRPGLVKVLGGWATNPTWTEKAFAATSTNRPNVIAVTNYFGKGIADWIWNEKYYSTLPEANLDKVLDEVESCFHHGGRERAKFAENAAMAKRLGVYLIAYEGGTHIVPTTAAQKASNPFMEFLFAMNSHQRMGHIYRHMLQAWWEEGGHLPNLFNLSAAWASWGMWGHLEYIEQPLTAAHKYREAADFSRKATTTHITTPTLPVAFVGLNYTHRMNACKGAGVTTLHWALGTAPDGWEITADGTLLGQPRTAGTFPITVQVCDNTAVTDNYTYDLIVRPTIEPIEVGPIADVALDMTKDNNDGFNPLLSNLQKDRKSIYLKFAIDRFLNNHVASARLVLFGDYGSTFSNDTRVGLFAVASNSWKEGEITPSNAPALGPEIMQTTIVRGNGTGGDYFSFDITQYLNSQVASGTPQVSIVMKVLSDGSKLAFRSKEYFDVGHKPPRLQVLLEAEAPPSYPSYDEFVQGYWPGQTDPSIISKTADPDDDGLANLAEYALLLNPLQRNTLDCIPYTDSLSGKKVVRLTFRTNETNRAVKVQPEWSTDLTNWHSTFDEGQVVDLTPDMKENTFLLFLEGLQDRYFRLQVSEN